MHSTESLAPYIKSKQTLENIFDAAEELFTDAGRTEDAEAIKQVHDVLCRDTFTVLVMGEFKRGKSTLIDALLGADILPRKSLPCTAAICRVRYGEKASIQVNFLEDLPQEETIPLPPYVQQHLKTFAGKGPVPPLAISPEKLRDVATISKEAHCDGARQKEIVAASPYESVDVFWPLEMCKQGVEIVDSPGLNEAVAREKVVFNFLNKADAIVFVIHSQFLASMSEDKTLERLNDYGYQDIFFACSHIDTIDDSELDELKNDAWQSLSGRTRLGKDAIVFINSKQALEAKQSQNAEKLAISGFDLFEQRLCRFLIEKRGNIKLMRPAQALRTRLSRFESETVPELLTMLEQNGAKLKANYERELPRLKAAENQVTAIRATLEAQCEKIYVYAQGALRDKIVSVAHELPEHIQSIETENSIRVWTLKSRRSQEEELGRELVEKCKDYFIDRITEWTNASLTKTISQKIAEMFRGVHADLNDFSKAVRNISTSLCGHDYHSENTEVSDDERFWASLVGYLALGPGTLFNAKDEGFKGLAKAALPNLGAAVVTMVLTGGAALPVVVATAITAFCQSLLGNKKAARLVRERVGIEFERTGIGKADEIARKAIEELRKNLENTINCFSKELMQKIQSIRSQVQQSLDLLQKGSAEIGQQKRRLQEAQGRSHDMLIRLDALLNELDS